VPALYDNSLNIVTEYTYDSWGRVLSITGSLAETVGKANPFRYRGYYYDSETELYYLNSRYYDPETGRFINADSQVSGVGEEPLGYNLFSYCQNNPTNMDDSDGNWPKWIGKAIAVVAVTTVVVAAVALTISTFGAGSVAGVAAISAAVTMAARATEVAVLQFKKSKNSAKNAGKKGNNTSNYSGNSPGGGVSYTRKSKRKVAADVTEAIFDNGLQIIGITPFTKAGSIGFNHILNQKVSEIFGETTTLNSTLLASGGKVVPYAFAVYAWCMTAISIFSDAPEERAEQRGYTLN